MKGGWRDGNGRNGFTRVLGDYRQEKAIIFFDFLVTVIAVTVYSFIATPVYEASATLMVSEQGSGAQAMLFDGLGGMGKNSAQNYMQIMKVALSCRRYVGRWA